MFLKKIVFIFSFAVCLYSCSSLAHPVDIRKDATKTVGIVIFPGFELLDVFGPAEMFGALPEKMKLVLIGTTSGNIRSHQGIAVKVDTDIAHAPHVDILLIPGGQGVRTEIANQALLQWLKKTASDTQYVLSVCTGSALLAKAGLLDNHRATSNKSVFDWVASQGPNVNWVRKARWVEDGKFITSSGVAAGIDMSLFFIEKLYGPKAVAEVENYTEYPYKSDASDDRFSDLYLPSSR